MELKKGYKQTEVGVIPEDWDVIELHQIAKFINGKAHEMFIDESGDYKVVNSKFVSSEGTVFKFSSSSLCPLNIGDITMVMSDIPNGKALAKCFLIDKNNTYTLNQRICALTPFKDSSNYLFKTLNRNKYFLAFDSGTGQTNLRRQEVLSCPVILPPKSEQTAIANALSDADAYITSLEKLIEKKRQIKQGAMQELLKPKDGWTEKSLGDIAEITMGQSPLSEYYNYNGVGLPLIQGNADIKNRKTTIRTYTSHVTKKASAGDIIMSVRAPVGEISKATFNCCIGRGVCSIRYENDFLYHYLVYSENKWGTYSSGSTFESVNSSQVLGYKLYIPNIIEQIRIAEILTSLDIELTNLEEMLIKAKLLKQGIMQQLLTGKIRLI
ncbi:MAG: restriction endonuclease subunit S [Bacteroidetes bacterium]|nr:restriction endonuclease subunit S [Bacteroidota bacterium]